MPRFCCVILLFATAAGSLMTGCTKHTPRGEKKSHAPNSVVEPVATNSPALPNKPGTVAEAPVRDGFTPFDPAQQKYDEALLTAVDLLAQGKYLQALASLEAAASFKDSQQVQMEIKNLRWRIDQQAVADNLLRDIQTLLDQGKITEADAFASSALKEYGSTDAAAALVKLKLQADAMVAARANDSAARRKVFSEQAQADFDAGSLRAAALGFEQALQIGDDPKLRARHDEVFARLAKYDQCREQAAELRKDSANLEDAIELLIEAAKQWDTPQVRQDLDEYKLALQYRRDRVAIADFELRGDADLLMALVAGRNVADELVPYFKTRFDVVERAQFSRLLGGLRMEPGWLVNSYLDQREVGRLAKVRYLVLGNITRQEGLTVHARLVDAASGLIAQTATVSAPSGEELKARLPELAKLLLMNDQERIAYEEQSALQAPPAEPVQANQPIPAAPDAGVSVQGSARPEIIFSNRPPELGGIKIGDFQGFQQLPDGQPLPAITFGGNAEEYWKKKALFVSLTAGDSLAQQGRHQEALRFFDFGMALGSGYVELDLRIARTRLQVTPPTVAVQPRETQVRVAVIDFAVIGDPNAVPVGLRWWTPQLLGAYLSGSFEVVDRRETNWWMGRMGMTLRDLIVDPYARRWLGRALNTRYFVFGTVTQTASFNVDTYLVDAEYGDLKGRGFVHARDAIELRWRLAELAGMTKSLGQWQQQQQAYREYEVLMVKAQDAIHRGEFSISVDFLENARKLRPNSLEIDFYFQQADTLGRQRLLEDERLKDFERQQTVVEEQKRRQEQLNREVEDQRLLAAKESEALTRAERDLAEKKHLKDKIAAHNHLLVQARLAIKRRDMNLSIQFYESALELHRTEEASHELAAARAEVERATKQHIAVKDKLHELKAQESREEELAKASARIEAEHDKRQQEEAALRKTQDDRDQAEYLRLVDQGQKQMAEMKYTAAISCFQAARQHKNSAGLDSLLHQAIIAQARSDADAKGAKARDDLEHRLTEAKAIREKQKIDTVQPHNPVEKPQSEVKSNTVVEAEALKKKAAFDQAIQQGQNLVAAKKYEDAIKEFERAGTFQPGDPHVASLIKQANTARAAAQHAADVEAANKKAVETASKQAEPATAEQKAMHFNNLMKEGNTALAAKKYAEAVKSFTDASKLKPTDPAASKALRDAQLQWTANKGSQAPLAGQSAEYHRQMQIGAEFDKQSKWPEAMKAYEAALKQIPKDAKATEALNSASYRNHMSEGNRFFTARRFADAVREFEAAAHLYPNDPDAAAAVKKAKEAK
jgi:hypothetical protein